MDNSTDDHQVDENNTSLDINNTNQSNNKHENDNEQNGGSNCSESPVLSGDDDSFTKPRQKSTCK